ncbi:MAG: lactate utilization protein [Patescibacteria group bacterium]
MNYDTLADTSTLTKTSAALAAHNFTSEVVASKEDALAKIKELIPANASITNGASRTLEQIGYLDYLKEGSHEWKDLQSEVIKEEDAGKRAALRRAASVSDYYLGSAHAVTEEGELFFASNSGSQFPQLAFTATNLILVVGAHKIVPTLDEARARLITRILPLEDENMKQKYGYGTQHNKTLILHNENPAMGRRVHVIFVNEVLGF